jgi:polar amino acid transport system permease protein
LERKKYKLTWLDIFIAMPVLTLAGYAGYRIIFGMGYNWQWHVIPQYIIRYDLESQQWVSSLLLHGLFATFRLSVWATILAIGIGSIMGLFRLSGRPFFRMVSRSYVELVRNLPPLVLIFIFYYFISSQILSQFDIDTWVRSQSDTWQQVVSFLLAPPRHLTAFLSGMVTLALLEGAYITEIVRAGIESVDRGQREAAYAQGFTRRQTMRHIIFPQALPQILPPLTGQLISTIKDSAIVSVISIQELTFQGLELMSATYLTFEIWITITVMYLVLTLACSLGVQYIEAAVKRRHGIY